MDDILQNPQRYIDMAIDFGISVVVAIVVFIIGLWVIRAIVNWLDRIMVKRDLDKPLREFLRSVVSILLKIALVIAIIGHLGVETTSFIALLGAIGFAVGMALSGTLQNFAGGVMILLFKPFKVGDYIGAQGHEGSVHEIQIFNTILLSLDNKRIIIPNGGLATNSMVNFTAEPTRRVDITFGIAYGDDTAKARQIILDILAKDERVLNEPEPFVEMSELADSSVNFAMRAWVKTADYWGVYFDTMREVYAAYDDAGINIPFPQMDVHVVQNAN